MNDIVNIFNNLPAHVRTKSKAMDAMAGGMAGQGFGNRISLRNSKFRFVQNGADIGAHDQTYLDVVIFALAASVQRLYYQGAYEPNTKTPPDCWSHDGKVPAPEATSKQSAQCGVCPQNVKGSGRMGNTKACAYKKRVVVLSPDDLEGPAYALDVGGQSMFGEQIESANKFSFKGYFEKLSAHGVSIDGIVTRLSFDDAASVPKLHFSPIRALTEAEYAVIQSRIDDEEVQKMLKDLTNEVEVDTFETPKAVAAPVAPAISPPIQVPKAVAPPVVVAPAPVARKGFGGSPSVPQAAIPAVAPTATQAAPKGLTLDLDSLTRFDD